MPQEAMAAFFWFQTSLQEDMIVHYMLSVAERSDLVSKKNLVPLEIQNYFLNFNLYSCC